MAKGTRLDVLLARRGLAPSRERARRLTMAGEVRVNGQVVLKPATLVDPHAALEVAARPPFVSRGGQKLEAALAAFGIEVAGRVCADVGASTGGFTDCLLQRGAAKVYAVDVGHGVLHWKLRNHPRVVVMERTNARYLEALPEQVGFVSMDVSFISLTLLLPVVKGWLSAPSPLLPSSSCLPADVVALIKPQFEAGRKDVGKGGVVKDPAIHRRVLEKVIGFADGEGLGLHGLTRSPLTGPAGNVEFLAWLRPGAPGIEAAPVIETVLYPGKGTGRR